VRSVLVVVSERTQFHLALHGAQWQIIRNGQVIFESKIKSEAVEEAEAAARMAHPSRLVIHNTDGTIGSERTYEDDPYRPVRKPRRRRHA
jgi:hypothetical protein